MKVYLQYPWKTSDTSYYTYLKQNCLNEIEYFPKEQKTIIQNKTNLKLNNQLKRIVKKLLRRFYPSLPNAHYTLNGNQYDLIHCGHCLSRNKQPWICDIEYVGQFWGASYSDKVKSKESVRKYVNSKYCKKILTWTQFGKNSILKEFPELKEKIKLMYPALPYQTKMNKTDNIIRILYISREFYLKGGDIALNILNKITSKYSNVEGIIISEVPNNIKNQYSKNKQIKIYNLKSQKELFKKIYPNCDIFLYPSFSDTLGFSILEAQSFGLPVITQKTYSTNAINELVINGKSGYIHNNLNATSILKTTTDNLINNFVKSLEILINDKNKLNTMQDFCREQFKNGKFSINTRNDKMRIIINESQ